NEEGVMVRVYSPTSRLLFESKQKDIPFERTAQPVVVPIDINGAQGLQGTMPIYSKRTQQLIGYIQVTSEMANYYRTNERVFFALVTINILALIFSSILGYMLAVNFLKPIKQITNTMNDIRKDTQSTSRIEVAEGNDELTHLSNVFNDMLDKMQQYIEQQK